MKKLIKHILRYFVHTDAIDMDDITKTPFKEPSHQLDEETLEVGEEARVLAKNLQEEGMGPEVSHFFHHIKVFYTTFVKTLMKKFPFHSTVLCDLRILNPSERRDYKEFPPAVLRLAKQFPQLGFSTTDKLEELKTEAIDFQMADAANLPEDTNIAFWVDLHNIKQIGSTTPCMPTYWC